MTLTAPTAGRRSRDALWVTAALGLVAALAWLYLVLGPDPMGSAVSGGMGAMEPSDGMGMDAMSMQGDWGGTEFALMWVMWAVMMAAMMLPSTIPLTHVYAAIGRKARRQGSQVPATALFVTGYLLVWAAFSIAATSAQYLLDRAAMLSDSARATSTVLAGVLLLATGIYELTPLKRSCLRACRGPIDFIARHWRSGVGGTLRLGAHAGLYCLGCCAMLMALLFLGGVMNLLWVAAVAVLVLGEKLLPGGERISQVLGVLMAVGGVGLLVSTAV